LAAAGAALAVRGDILSFADDKDGHRRRKSSRPPDSDAASASRSKKKRSDSGEIGDALRSIYDRTVSENIPREMLDLLGKLG
jgi:hypothetical protein